MTAAEKALELVQNDSVIGLGTGKAATAFIRALGERVKMGLRVRGIPTSQMSADLATQLGIPLVSMAEVREAAQTFDGADEVDPNLDLIKGYGGALVREKIVAAFSRKLVILVGDEKIVAKLGSRGKLPVEVVPFGEALCARELKALGCRPVQRQVDHKPFVTDNGNHILDCGLDPIGDPADFERRLLAIPGVVGTGLFLGMAQTVIVEKGDTVEVMERSI